MEFVKHVIGTEIVYYPKLESIVDRNKYVLLGFKDSLPVLSNNMESNSSKHQNIKKTVKIETNSQTGEKFIMLNGKRIKILAESQLPKSSQIVKIASLQKLPAPQTLKFKILKGVPFKESLNQNGTTLPNLVPLAVDKNITSEIKHKFELIAHELQKIPSSIAEHTNASETDNSGIDADNTKMIKTAESIGGKHMTTATLNESLNTSSVQCTALDLTKNCQTKTTNSTYVMKEDKSAQVSVSMCNKEVQVDIKVDKNIQTTDQLFDSDLDSIFNLDLFEDFNVPTQKCLEFDSDFGGVSNNNLKYTSLVPVSEKNEGDSRRKMQENFFKELKSALQVDDKGNMPIHVGVLRNDSKSVKRSCFILNILNQSVDIPNNNDMTPLQLAIINDSSLDIVSFLLQKGAKIDQTDAEGNNLLHYAVEYDRTEALTAMLSYVNQQRFNLDQHNHEGLTPLMICCMNNLYDCAEKLLDYDANPNVRDQISGRTALFHAAETHDVELVDLLLQYNADTKIKNFFGTSPHDAMYEIDEMPEQIKFRILGKNNKRKNVEESKLSKFSKKAEITQAGLKTYARAEKVHINDLKNFKKRVK